MSSSKDPRSATNWKVGDQVWVKTGSSASDSNYEELATITKLPTAAITTTKTTMKKRGGTKKKKTNDDDDDDDDKMYVKYVVSGFDMSVEPNRLRLMGDVTSNSSTGRRRSVRSAVANTTGSATKTSKKFVVASAATITPSPTFTEFDVSSTNSSNGRSSKRKSCSSALDDGAKQIQRMPSKKKTKSVHNVSSSGEKNIKDSKGSPYFEGKGSPYFANNKSNNNASKKNGKKSSDNKGTKNNNAASRGGRRKLMLASASEDEEDEDDDMEIDVDALLARRKRNIEAGMKKKKSAAGGTKSTSAGSAKGTKKQSTAAAKKKSDHDDTKEKKKKAPSSIRKKPKKDPNAPKNAKSAYIFFSNAQRTSIKESNPNSTFGDITKLLGAAWKQCDDKTQWEEMAKDDKERYRKEMDLYVPPPPTLDDDSSDDDEGDGDNKKQKRQKKTNGSAAAAASHNNDTAAPPQLCLEVGNQPPPVGNQPDGHGGLNQPTQPWVVEYSKTGRATCRTCDEKILKGKLRVGHTPLFRGKPGYMVYRHLKCATFSEEIVCAEDVEGYEDITEEDYARLAEQVVVSKDRIKEEREELHPDELVQKSFTGEVRSTPKGLTATLLPFQVEGFSWMRHQEVMEDEIRGGILADEMGMGKTVQTIATVLDNRPTLQHCKAGMKHPPNTSDIQQRRAEEELWNKAKVDWSNEMDLLKVSKKLRTQKGGDRAGTLVICPVIALTQWKMEIEKFTEDGTLSVCTYHGPDRETQKPRELMKKYDVVLTTYQVLESDFRKMISPNRVECPNCGGKFKIDKLPIHLKYFCGENAERTEAQARQRRGGGRGGGGGGGGGGNGGRRGGGRRPDRPFGKSDKDKKDDTEKKQTTKSKVKDKSKDEKKKAPAKKKPVKKKTGQKKSPPENIPDGQPTSSPRAGSRRSASLKAASQISKSAAEWMPPDDDDSDNFRSGDESSGDDSSDGESDDDDGYSSDSSGDNSAVGRAREKQRQALEFANNSTKKKTAAKKKQPASKAKGKKVAGKKKPAAKGKGKKKKFDDDSDDEGYSSSDSISYDIDEIDMKALMEKAMSGAKNSVLHSLCWWRIILDEAHFIKTRSSQTANAAFSLIGVHRWALSGTPLQNRVGEFYSLVRFLRLNPMAYYYCRSKDCDCKSMHYRIHAGICEGCGHSGIQHYSHFNKYILNPIQRDGYSGDGRKAMFLLKNEVLDKALLRRTKETKAADMELPPRLVQIKPVRLHPVEEDFYSALYTQTKSSFDDYVESGTLLNNYAHIFDLLIRMRQSVDHPYLVIHSKKNTEAAAAAAPNPEALAIANGSTDCDLCAEPPEDRLLSTCCGAAYCRACVLEYMATSSSMAASASLSCPSCRGAFSIDLQASADVEDDATLTVVPAAKAGGGSTDGMPSLKELQHVATGSILRRINLADFATSSKIEALTRELVLMRQTSPGSKAIVFSQFVNMLDLIRWRLHSDPYLEDIGLGCKALHGGMNIKARDACLKDFREDNNVRVLLMSLKAGGVALNLTCANYIYLMDPWWNPAAEMQAIDRTHRLGQYRPIRAVRFIAENTVEERILQLQEKKRLVFDGTVGRDAGSLKMLTVNDMKSLFA